MMKEWDQLDSNLSVPTCRDGFGTFSRYERGEVVKASQGHYPLPFWISE